MIAANPGHADCRDSYSSDNTESSFRARNPMPQSNVVITGLGVVSSIGIGCEPFFEGLLAKRSGIRTLADRTDQGAKPAPANGAAANGAHGIWIGGPIVDFDPKQYVRPRKSLKVMCREIQLAFAASQLAIDHAGLADQFPAAADGDLKPIDIGTVFGSEMFYGPPSEMEDAIRNCMLPDGTVDGSRFGRVAMRQITPLWMLKYLPNMPACHIGIALNAHGPNNSLIAGDISGPAAMIEAASCLDRRIAKVMVSGATGARISTARMNYRGDSPFPVAESPLSNSSRPHDPQSKGVVGGEAAVTMILETDGDARNRDATPLAILRSYASRFIPSRGMMQSQRSSSIKNAVGLRGSSRAIATAIATAIRDAELGAEEIGMVVGHATGDPVMDAEERAALGEVLPGVPVVAPVASLGHTGAASGDIGLLVGAMSLAKRVVPPTLNAEASDGLLRSEPEDLRQDHVICLSHTSEGNATAVVLSQPR